MVWDENWGFPDPDDRCEPLEKPSEDATIFEKLVYVTAKALQQTEVEEYAASQVEQPLRSATETDSRHIL